MHIPLNANQQIKLDRSETLKVEPGGIVPAVDAAVECG